MLYLWLISSVVGLVFVFGDVLWVLDLVCGGVFLVWLSFWFCWRFRGVVCVVVLFWIGAWFELPILLVLINSVVLVVFVL